MANPLTRNFGPIRTEIGVGMNECRISINGERLVARRVFSDIVIAMHAPAVKFAGLLRFTVAPEQSPDELKAVQHFLEAALAEVFDGLRSMAIDTRTLAVYLIGGAHLDGAEESQPAEDLQLAAKRALWREGIAITADDLGGNQGRSIWLDGDTGRLIVRSYAPPVTNPAGVRGMIPDSDGSSTSSRRLAS